jgi:hypothetical protein
MITPSFGLTATERVLPRLALDWTTGLTQSGVDVTRAGVATVVNSNGLIATVSADTQRIDYKTGAAGLLVEESRINRCLYSEDFRNTADAGETRPWVYESTAVITSTIETAPNGTSTATLVDSPSEAGIRQTVTVTSGTAHTQHWFLKAGTVTSFRLRDDVNNISVIYNLSTGAITSSNATSATITPLADGWYWVTATYTTAATTARVWVRPSTAGTYYQWGAQLEAGAFPTSYIPTEATTVTRNADVATMTGTNFSDWFNASAGTFFINTNARNADVLLTAGSYTLSANATTLKKYATTYSADPSATELAIGKGTIQKINYYKQALLAAELAALTA